MEKGKNSMRTIEVKLFQFEELSDRAKETAREWYRNGLEYDANFEPYETAAKLLGITFETKDGVSDIRYSGFSSQGDGASFVGRYAYVKGCAQAVRTEFGTDETLHAIADELNVLYTRYLLAHGTTLVARITQDGRYMHKYTMEVEVNEADGETGIDEKDADEFRELMRDFAQWIYDGLESDYESQMSDECVDDSITANEYEFTEEGDRA